MCFTFRIVRQTSSFSDDRSSYFLVSPRRIFYDKITVCGLDLLFEDNGNFVSVASMLCTKLCYRNFGFVFQIVLVTLL